MEENLGNTEQLENFEKMGTSKWKKRINWIFVGLGLIILFVLLFFLTIYILYKLRPQYGFSLFWLYPIPILIPLFVEFLIIIFIKCCNSKQRYKIRKHLRSIIMISFFVVIVIRFFLTKSFMIRDYFEINCLGKKRIMQDNCVDCKCAVKSSSVFSPNLDGTQYIDGKNCCKGTYTYNILHGAN